jgi:signal transduction histidine kinase
MSLTPHLPLTRRSALDDPRLLAFDLLERAIWITDPDEARMVWANRAALGLWLADDLDELLSRDTSTLSETARLTLLALRDRVAKGERVRSERTIYPRGTPVRIEMSIGAYLLPDGRTGLLVEGQPLRGPRPDPDVIRSAEASRYAPLSLSTHDLQGRTLTRNARATGCFGTEFSFASLFMEPEEAQQCFERLLREGWLQLDALLRTVEGPRWHALDARTMPDPETGQTLVVLSLHDITQRVAAERAKDEFIAVVNHELRTPLSSIRGALGLLHAGVMGELSDEARQLVGIAEANSRRLGELIDDLLDVQALLAHGAPDSKTGREEGSGLELRLRSLDPTLVIEQAVQLLGGQIRDRRIDVRCSLPAEPARVCADERRLMQLMTHLLANAVKYGPAGGTVLLTLRAEPDRVRCTIEDQGPGVPATFRARLFQRFAQADSSAQRSGQGTGLGLYLCRQIVEGHGGEIGYEDREGGGSRFWFTLPSPCPDGQAAAP